MEHIDEKKLFTSKLLQRLFTGLGLYFFLCELSSQPKTEILKFKGNKKEKIKPSVKVRNLYRQANLISVSLWFLLVLHICDILLCCNKSGSSASKRT